MGSSRAAGRKRAGVQRLSIPRPFPGCLNAPRKMVTASDVSWRPDVIGENTREPWVKATQIGGLRPWRSRHAVVQRGSSRRAPAGRATCPAGGWHLRPGRPPPRDRCGTARGRLTLAARIDLFPLGVCARLHQGAVARLPGSGHRRRKRRKRRPDHRRPGGAVERRASCLVPESGAGATVAIVAEALGQRVSAGCRRCDSTSGAAAPETMDDHDPGSFPPPA